MAQVGSQFEAQYEKIRLLGEGAFGSAYLVQPRDKKGVRYVAKEIRTAHLTPKQRQSAVGEAETLRKLQHPNVIGYETSFSEDARMYIVMEYADGGDLGEKIKVARDSDGGAGSLFSEQQVMFVFVQMCLALMHVHSRKILHRDLKPMNVFLTSQGNVKLGDFGVSTLLDSTTAGAQTMIGTPFYLSPEICNGEAYGVKSDVWSFGVVAYEVACLRVPFHAHALPAVALKICNADPEPLPDVYPQELHSLVISLLDKEPKRRPKLRDLFAIDYVKRWAQENLSHTQATGTGGCEEMANRHVERDERSGGGRERRGAGSGTRSEKAVDCDARRRLLEAEHQDLLERQRRAMLAEFLERKEMAEANKRRVEAAMERDRRSGAGDGQRSGSEGDAPAEGGIASARAHGAGGSRGPERRRNGSRGPEQPRGASNGVGAGSGEDNREEVRKQARREQADRDARRQQELVEAMKENEQHRRAAERQRLARIEAERREKEAEAGGAEGWGDQTEGFGATVNGNPSRPARFEATSGTLEAGGATAMVLDFSSDFKKARNASSAREPRRFQSPGAANPAPPPAAPPAPDGSRPGEANCRQMRAHLRSPAGGEKVEQRPRASLQPLDVEADAPKALVDSFPRRSGSREGAGVSTGGGGGAGLVMVFDFTEGKQRRRHSSPRRAATTSVVPELTETFSQMGRSGIQSLSDTALGQTLKLESPTKGSTSSPSKPPRLPPSPADGHSAAGPPARWLRSQAAAAASAQVASGGRADGFLFDGGDAAPIGIAGRQAVSPSSPVAATAVASPLAGRSRSEPSDDSQQTLGSLSLSASPAPTPCGMGEVSQLQSALEGALAGPRRPSGSWPVGGSSPPLTATIIPEELATSTWQSCAPEVATDLSCMLKRGEGEPMLDTACSVRTDWDLSDSD